jgi:hypothetical protein
MCGDDVGAFVRVGLLIALIMTVGRVIIQIMLSEMEE